MRGLIKDFYEQGKSHPQYSQLKFAWQVDNFAALRHGLVYGVRQKFTTGQERQVRPVTASLVVTPDCNLHCRACPYQHEGKRELEPRDSSTRVMDRDLAKHILDQLSRAGVKAVIFTGGGEPFSHQDTLFEIMLEAKRRHFQIGIFTNGVLARQELLRSIVTELAPELQFIRVSINACDEETYVDFHRAHPNNYQRAASNVMFLAKLRQQGVFQGSLGLGFLVNGSNVHSFFQLLDFVEQLIFDQGQQVGIIDYAALRPQVEYERNVLCGGRAEQQPRDVFESISYLQTLATRTFYEKLRRLQGFRPLLISERFAGLERPQQTQVPLCTAHPWRTAIWWDGGVYTCDEHNGEEAFRYGSLQDTNWPGVWYGEGRRSVIAALNRDYFQAKCPPICVLSFLNLLFYPLLQLNKAQARQITGAIKQLSEGINPRDVNFL
jgi:sulfatase maturation enzyme AslB (radical SAM superfamily)